MKKRILIVGLFFFVIFVLAGCRNLGDQISEKWNKETNKDENDQTNKADQLTETGENAKEEASPAISDQSGEGLAEKNNASVATATTVPKDRVNKIFFGSKKYDPEAKNCSAVYWVDIRGDRANYENMDPVERNVRLLLAGLPEKWAAAEYFTSIPDGTKLNSIRAEGNNIYLDFSAELNQGGGSCVMAQRRAQIDATVRATTNEFLGQKIDYVIISVNGGKPEEALQP